MTTTEQGGCKAKVYRWRKWDIRTGDWIISTRWATLEAIKGVEGEAMGEGVEVDPSVVNAEGMTAKHFEP